MKRICLLLCFFTLPLATLAEEKAQPSTDPPQPTGAEAVEPEFHDPFAAEDAENKPALKIKDPLEGMNRAFFRFNDKLYFWVLKPAAQGYRKVTPRDFRSCMKRFFVNLRSPIRIGNNLLQARFKEAGIETGRFLVNSTAGLAGLYDPATEWKLPLQPADFDQTLGVYGFAPGIYFNWPIFGPSSVRGTAGRVGDSFLTPYPYIDYLPVRLGVPPYEIVNSTTFQIGDYESFKKAALDPYVALRSAYFESRREAVAKAKLREPKKSKKSTPDSGDQDNIRK